jgi:autotransporter-associated beta strand protein
MKKIIASILLTTGLSLTAQAIDGSWAADADGAWTNTASWTGGIVPGITGDFASPDIATFSVTLTTNRTVTVDANRNIGGIIFANPANVMQPVPQTTTNAATSVGYTLSGGSLLLSNGGVIQVADGSGTNSSSISSPILILDDGGSATFRNDAAGNKAGLLITGAVSGSSTPGGTTTLYLDGVSTSTGIGGASRNNTVGVISDGTDFGSLKVVKNGTGIWLIAMTGTFTGGLDFNAGTIRYFNSGNKGFGNGIITLSNGVEFMHANSSPVTITNQMVVNGNFELSGAANAAFSGAMNFGAATRTITVTGGTNTTIAGVISGSGGLTKTGADPLTLSGANTYSGTTTVSQGALIANADRALGGTASIQVSGGTTLTLTNGVLNNYINDLASLKLATNSTLNLNFTGTDTIGLLSLDNGTTWLTNGTYNVAALAAAGGKGTYTGAGVLNVNSEPVPVLHPGLVFMLLNTVEPLDVYVCAGQSNMAGAGKKAELPAELQAAQTNVFVFNGTSWDVMEPTTTGVGPEISFAYEMQKVLNKPIGIVLHAVGGTSLATNWNPEISANLYAILKDKVTAAGQSRKISVKGMIWMQGENDSRYETMASAYSHNLTNLMLAARADYDSPVMPFVAGRVDPPYTYAYLVRAAQETCTVPLYAYINCDDLTRTDAGGLHYDTAGLVEMGKRFSQSILNLQ